MLRRINLCNEGAVRVRMPQNGSCSEPFLKVLECSLGSVTPYDSLDFPSQQGGDRGSYHAFVEGHLPLVPLSDLNQMIGAPEVQFGEYLWKQE